MLTYGDGLSNINLSQLLKFHLKHKKIATLSAVRPPARFGEGILAVIKKNKKISRKTTGKFRLDKWWIFVFNSKIFKYLSKNQMLERQPIKKLLEFKNLLLSSIMDFGNV